MLFLALVIQVPPSPVDTCFTRPSNLMRLKPRLSRLNWYTRPDLSFPQAPKQYPASICVR